MGGQAILSADGGAWIRLSRQLSVQYHANSTGLGIDGMALARSLRCVDL